MLVTPRLLHVETIANTYSKFNFFTRNRNLTSKEKTFLIVSPIAGHQQNKYAAQDKDVYMEYQEETHRKIKFLETMLSTSIQM